MASRADNLASNLSLANFSKATELRQRIWFTVVALIAFRFLSFVPLPGVNPQILGDLYDQTRGGVLDLFNTFSGGSLERMSLIALGVMPYITASIVVQMASALHPTLMALKKEGATGRQKLNQYTRYGTVFLCVIQGYFLATGLESYGAQSGLQAVVDPGIMFRIGAVISLVGGTMLLLWIGEQITARGIGNGVSLIIMAGIVAQFPSFASNMFEGGRTGAISAGVIIGFIVMIIGLILFISFMERAQRRLLIQYPKRATQRGMMQADRSHLPLKINTSGVIPPIFASSLLLLPLTISQFAGSSVDPNSGVGRTINQLNFYLQHGQPIYMALYAILIVFFCFFYTAVVFNPEETADNLKKNGGFIPGIRPGKRTAEYLDYVLTRITVVGAAYLTLVCVLPEYMIAQTGIPLFLGGTSLLIVVNVTVDTISQIQSHLLAHQYGDLIKKAKLKGRLR
ncbi:preprotein translocase subunit SecY [Citromicrobium bathyomarinum]|uniref:preprotein translocase subunit SecY n=1 Tax=Sphingomonadales TaxID=204457 RepID=UPI0001DD093C|nr:MULTISPECIES: preprotein translocase subunit SecY [Sphingomonadales]MAO03225.1 preprotein translocase subunit SecY [Citromicrobium sp.]ALG61838.1 preprotein translocase subunit SecY [Citromicrobium sp. JL477]KPM15523.1 preprotein translocase subunit SecY [Citromicrobium sp. JL31]KPM16430.1 preprotein translocase subunit SecY [Citromicrobium sp. JL1351]KPM21865.1 preprotein translocase subunit SecY [Citromicrobium sp. JL2201]|tara:strand:- start:16108 stop:17472 length:1365 start_codon:yes stop_codon:yes gene_type:complete